MMATPMQNGSGLRRVVITGGAGNLGQKLAALLDAQAHYDEIVLIDRVPSAAAGRIRSVVADLSNATDEAWIEAVADAEAVVHLAADNPYPDCTWEEACRSLDMTANVCLHAIRRPTRLVFASSNHVMGGYKELDVPPGSLDADTAPLPGTRFHTPQGFRRDLGYASAKLLGERLVRAAASASDGRMTAVCLRIGWCQPGANHPATITADGLKPDAERATLHEGYERDLRWFRSMWLSNRDFLNAMSAALSADATSWPQPAVVVNAMSANDSMPWDTRAAQRLIGYTPEDNVWSHLQGA